MKSKIIQNAVAFVLTAGGVGARLHHSRETAQSPPFLSEEIPGSKALPLVIMAVL